MRSDTREKLMEALAMLEQSEHAIDFAIAFGFLRLYLPGGGEGEDEELRCAFTCAQHAIRNRSRR